MQLGHGQCSDCWKEREYPSVLSGKRKRRPSGKAVATSVRWRIDSCGAPLEVVETPSYPAAVNCLAPVVNLESMMDQASLLQQQRLQLCLAPFVATPSVSAAVNDLAPGCSHEESVRVAAAPAPAPVLALPAVFNDDEESPEGEAPSSSNMENFVLRALDYIPPNGLLPPAQILRHAPAPAPPAPALALAPSSVPAVVNDLAFPDSNSYFEIRIVEGRGRGLFVRSQARSFKKGDLLTPYDGPRRDSRNGSLSMHCSRVTDAISTLSGVKKAAISQLRFTKTWAVSVNRQRSCRVVVDGTISASPILDDVPNRAGIGLAALANSSEGTGSFTIL